MNGPRIGSLFSGYGGLDMGVMAALGGSVAWHVEFDKAPSKILAHHWPDVPNYGDVTAVDWSAVEPVDIITGGSPCQDLSHAGKRAGMTEGTRSNLWVAMREAIAQLRPGLVVWENVRGAYSAEADSDLEFCSGCMGDPWDRGPVLRALGRVLGDLSDLGYDSRWHGLRAANVGAPHSRFRVFVVAYLQGGLNDAGTLVRDPRRSTPVAHSRRGDALAAGASLLPTPTSSDTNGAGAHGDGGLDLRTVVSLLPTPVVRDYKGAGPADMERHSPNLSAIPFLLPTPTVNDMGAAYTPETWDQWTAKMKEAHGNGNGHGPSLNVEVQRIHNARSWVTTEGIDYGPAIRRWERLTRIASEPVMLSKKGTPQLNPAFSEWLMGLPAGHVTDVSGLSRNDMLKALGNGVVPQQAEAAMRFLLGVQAVAA